MKYLYILIAVFSLGINDIAKVNTLKEEAEKAYDKGDYETALAKYQFLVDSMDVSSDEITLNMAHSFYHLEDTANARSLYQELSNSENKKIKSASLNQIGVLSDKPESMKAALNYFKEALKTDPTNKEARYNYEVLKKRIKEQEEQQKQDQQNQDKDNQDQEKKDQKEEEKEQEQKSDEEKKGDKEEEKKDGDKSEEEKKGDQEEQKDKEGEEKKDGKEQDKKEGEEKDKEGEKKDGEEKEGEEGKEKKEEQEQQNAQKSAEQKLKEMNISPQQAKMILEAMKNQEIQHLQQIRRRPTKKRDTGKPDW